MNIFIKIARAVPIVLALWSSFSGPAALAQLEGQINVFRIDTTQFPTIKAHFYATDGRNVPLRSLSLQDFTVTESGVERTVTKVTCPPVQGSQPLSVVLAIDLSGLQGEGIPNTGTTLLETAERAAETLIDKLPAGSECALLAFDKKNYTLQGLTTDKQLLFDVIPQIRTTPETSFNLGFFHEPGGGLEILKQGKYKRAMIFLTDGITNTEPNEAQIITLANELDVTVYCVSMGSYVPFVLKTITKRTGGEWMESLMNPYAAEKTFTELVQIIVAAQPCQIEWQSDIICNREMRGVTVSIPAHFATTDIMYKAPKKANQILTVFPALLDLGGVVPGTTKDTTITITCRNSIVPVQNITVSDPDFTIIDYGGSAPPFILQENESRDIRVQFTPSDSLQTEATLTIANDFCSDSVTLSGGFDQILVKQTLQITFPKSGELWLAGTDSLISWEGIAPQDTISLFYSTDNGNSWQLITSEATGLRYRWKIPNLNSDKCLIHAELGTDNSVFARWARKVKCKTEDFLTSIARDKEGNIYICGKYGDRADFGLGEVIAETYAFGAVYRSGYIAKYNTHGTIEWVKRITGRMISIVVGNDGNIYTTGDFSPGNRTADAIASDAIYFQGGITMNNLGRSSNGFIAKYDPEGNNLWVRHARGTVETSMKKLHFHSDNSITVTGDFDSDVEFGSGINLAGSNRQGFTARYSSDGEILEAKQLSGSIITVLESAIDPDGNVYVNGLFYPPFADFGSGVILNSSDNYYPDGFLAKYDADGNILWAKKAGGDNEDRPMSLILDSYGNAYSCGYFRSTSMDIGGGILLNNNDANTDFYMIKYDPDGNPLWGIQSKNNNKFASANNLTTDPNGSMYLTGYFRSSSLDLGNGIILTKPTSSFAESFIAKFSTNGTILWAEKITGNTAISLAARNEIVIGGVFSTDSIFFGNGVTLGAGQEYNWGDSFVVKYQKRQVFTQYDTSGVFSISMPMKNIVLVEEKSAYVGERVDITLKVTEGTTLTIAAQKPKGFSAIVAYQNSILSPLKKLSNAKVIHGNSFDTLQITDQWNGTNPELAVIPARATLGDTTSSILQLLSFHWKNDAGEILDFDTELYDGNFTLLGICQEGGERLYDSDGQAQMMLVMPHPARGIVDLQFETVETGITIIILTDALGQHTLLQSSQLEKGLYTVKVDTEQFTEGLYLLTMQTPTQVFMEKFLIVK